MDMMQKLHRSTGYAILVPLFLGIMCCGGGGSNNPVNPPTGITATFTGEPTVGNSLSMQPGNSSGAAFEVRIVATGINDFYDSSFSVTFDPAVAQFASIDSTGSFLLGAGITTEFDATEPQAGTIDIVARRVPAQNAGLTFEAPAPGNSSISMQPGTIAGDEFEVVISVTGVNDFFGSAFRVDYDAQSASFESYDAASSLLLGGGVQTNFEVTTPSAGQLAVVATRLQDDTGTVPGVNVAGTQELISLTFRATQFTAANQFTFGAPREVCDSDQPVCTPINVSWDGGTMRNAPSPTGVDVVGSQNLVILNFTALVATVQSPFEFADPRQICDSTGFPGGCNPIVPTYLDGVLDAR